MSEDFLDFLDMVLLAALIFDIIIGFLFLLLFFLAGLLTLI